MTETLFHAYTPLLFWTALGYLLFQRLLPDSVPKLLGRSLYWVGVPVEILALTRRTPWDESPELAPAMTIAVLLVGSGLAFVSLRLLSARVTESSQWLKPSFQGGFVLSAVLGNTGFVGLAIAPYLVSDAALSFVVFYSVTNNVIGTYGLGVLLASYFGQQSTPQLGWGQIRAVLSVPSLWTFGLGAATRSFALPAVLEEGLQAAVWVVIPAAFLLMGMRLSQIQGWKSLRLAIAPAAIKVLALPTLVGIGCQWLALSRETSLAFVLMSGMPTAFASLILAEEYELDREVIASSIVLSTLVFLLVIPLWLVWFGNLQLA